MDLLIVIAVVAFSAVGAAAFASRNRIADEEVSYLRRLFVLYRGRREQYNAVGRRALVLTRILFLAVLALLIAQIVYAVRAG
jgi:hypothetical protein